jgi:hypothetical protein
MKKIFTTLVAIFAITQFSYGQVWTRSSTDTTNIYNLNSGKVGIGTTSPGQLLQVSGASGAAISINTPWAGDAFGQLRFDTGIGNASIRSYVPGNSTNGLQFFTYSGGSEIVKMTITGDGKIGIGTTSPSQSLSINGNTLIQNGSVSSKGYLFSSPSSNWGPQLSGLYFTPRDGVDATTDFAIKLWDAASQQGGASATRLFIDATSGYVGIGTTIPDEKLTIKGKIHAEEVKIDLSVPAPDYVFENDYKLPALNYLKSYINKNHHLPEIPSAKAMEKNGINLGEMNTLLLKKVEELTLYVIKQDKQLKQQSDQIKAIQGQLPRNKRK